MRTRMRLQATVLIVSVLAILAFEFQIRRTVLPLLVLQQFGQILEGHLAIFAAQHLLEILEYERRLLIGRTFIVVVALLASAPVTIRLVLVGKHTAAQFAQRQNRRFVLHVHGHDVFAQARLATVVFVAVFARETGLVN